MGFFNLFPATDGATQGARDCISLCYAGHVVHPFPANFNVFILLTILPSQSCSEFVYFALQLSPRSSSVRPNSSRCSVIRGKRLHVSLKLRNMIVFAQAFYHHRCNRFPNGSSPHKCHSIYFWNSLAPTHVVEFDDNAMQVSTAHSSAHPPTPPLSLWSTPHPTQISSTRLPLTQPFLNQKTHSPLQTKLNAYLLHASQVHSEPSTREFLTFIGNHTPHSSALEFAEGFQVYKS